MQDRNLISAIALSFLCCLLFFVTLTAGKCGVSAPQVTLSELHPGCNSNRKSRDPDCVSAIHRFCGRVRYPTAMTTLGVSLENTYEDGGKIGVDCIRSQWSGSVPIVNLQQYHSGCTFSKSQHRHCLSAVHRFCKATLGGEQFAGISQEALILPGTKLFVKCFETPRKEHVRGDVLATHQTNCRLPDSDSDACFSAAGRFCISLGYSGGITQEVDANGAVVACYNAEFQNDEFVSRSFAYFQAENRAVQVCSFDFDIDHGALLSETPQFLKTETYDNRASSVTLRSNFEVSKGITETSSFTHSHSFTIGAEVSVSVGLPSIGLGGSISLSASATTGLSLTRETMITNEFSTTSPVEVPPGEGIVKEAIVQQGTITVPWTAKIINGLGAESTIGGQWRGTNAFNFRVEQEDIDGFCPCSA